MKIQNFARLEYLTAFALEKRSGRHSRLTFSASIVEGQAARCLECSGKNISVALEDDTPIFHGRIEAVELEQSLGARRVNVEAVSLSIATDETPHTRIFHAPDKKFSDILRADRLKLSTEHGSVRLGKELAALPCESVVVQYAETNFAFIDRLARRLGTRLWIVDTMSGQSELIVDRSTSSSQRKIKRDQIIRLSRRREGSAMKFRLTSFAYFELGSIVSLELTDGMIGDQLIVALTARLENEAYYFEYELESPSTLRSELVPPPLESSIKLHATVTKVNVAECRIQVHFDDEFIEDMDQSSPLWIEYREPYCAFDEGMVFPLKVGDEVEVLFVNGSLSMSTARRKDAAADKYKIIMTGEGIELHAGSTVVTLTDAGIEIKAKTIKSEASDAVEVKAKTIKSEASDAVEVKAKTLKSEASDAVEIKAKTIKSAASDAVEVKAKTIKSEASDAVEVKAKTIKSEASDAVEVKAKTIKSEASDAVEVKAGGAVAIKGSTIENSASGGVVIKGSTIKLC